ncbi:hypothetical protein LAZ67_14002248 [Cordylochernes scorpioides]|uniref:CCHC-type domain-containing protein n=1 Tax=Cordylochernes scorpioides TaxID=51811 RepID=A0ABY6L7W6_9ARAC|nr:hypothetical protein LAZ67_14002248 [Cordylochernes scorpioides]
MGASIRWHNPENNGKTMVKQTSQPGPSEYKTNTPNKYQKVTIVKEEKAKKPLAHFLVQNSPKVEAEKAKWIQQDAQAKCIITCAMNDSQVALILTCNTSKEIWTSLQKGYEGNVKRKSIEARNEVSRLQMKKEEKWQEYILRAEKMLENARILGDKIDEEEFTTALIEGLPSKYNIIAMQIDSMDNPTIDNIRRLFELYQERYCNQEKYEHSSAYKVYNKNKYKHYKETKASKMYKCFICHKQGHKANECWHNPENNRKTMVKQTSQPGPSEYKTNTPNKYQKVTIVKEEKASEFAKLVKEMKILEQLWILDKRKAYRICEPKDLSITESRDVKFLENKKGAVLLDNDNTTTTQDYSLIEIFENDNSEETFPLQEPEDVAESQEENLFSPKQTSPRYNLRPNVRDQIYYELSSDEEPIFDNEDKDPTYEPEEEAFKVSHGDLLPSSNEEAISNPDSTLWRQATNKEIHYLKDHHVWNLIELPQVMKTDSFRTLLAYATMMDYEFHHFDVETAFLYGKLTETIYMTQPEGYQRQDPAQERTKFEETAKPQPGATIGRDASSDPVVLNPNIDIPKYDVTEDPRPWIESLEEIGFLYHWADYIISRYAAMNMIGSAKTWLNLHNISFTSWENFKSRLIEDFASDANKEEMKMRLNRMQQWNEPAIRFAEDILEL